ncbi:hypothetical protein ABIB85_007597, partial [Bradyrhizobium sp. JR1.5]
APMDVTIGVVSDDHRRGVVLQADVS